MVSSPGEAVAGVPLLETKLYIPKWRPGLVSRPRLVAALEQGTERTLTLISAPAGFGKTTLLAEWLAASPAGERKTAWLSLDPTDNDPALFWTYVISALQSIRPGIGANALALLQSPQPPPITSILTSLINEISAVEHDFTLILDDLHVIEAQPVHEALAFLIDHLPPRLRLVIASRADPPLPLARLRARGELTELRAADLRFTPDEAAAFLNEVMGLDLAADDVMALETRTEGWIAGLQLAALSMRGRADVSGFVAVFTGDARYILDYLVEEVLQRQPDHVRSFLLQTSILDRLSGPLCDAVTGREDGRRMLESLERANLFVVPMDDKRLWYRYHHLFADVLRTHLPEELPGQMADLHGRASEWYAQNGSPADAIRHALAAGDSARAANLVELAATAMFRNRQEATFLGWLKLLPDELVRARPVLSAFYAGALLSNGELEGVEERLRDAERWLALTADTHKQPTAPSAEMVVVDHEGFRRLPAWIAVHRAGMSLALGDLAATVDCARRALAVAREDDHFHRGAAAALLGLASWASGDLDAAYESYADGMASLQRAGFTSDSIGGVTSLADIRIEQGRLHDAMSIYARALQRATEHGAPVLRGAADMHVGMSELHREWNDLETATEHLEKSKELGEHAGFPQNPYRWCVAMAKIRVAQGNLNEALDLLDEAERIYVSDFHPNVRPIAAQKVQVWLTQGRLADALDWVRAQDLSAADEIGYLREYEHLTLARVLIAQHERERDDRMFRDALRLLERLLQSAEAGQRRGIVIEILVVQALAFAGAGDSASALASLERALTLAEPEGYVRLFTGEGDAMRTLLRQAAARGTASAYTHRLLSAFDAPHSASRPAPAAATALAEPLTAREIEILRLIAAGLRNEQIAGRLYISLATVKRHIANAYGKLGVSHRTEAVAKARDLDLL